MKSANQIIQYESSISFNVTELNAETVKQLTIESPLSGRLLRVHYSISWDDLSNTAAMGLLVSRGQSWGRVAEVSNLFLQAFQAWRGNGKIAAVEASSVPAYFHLDSQINVDIPDNTEAYYHKTKSIDQLVTAGDNINLYGIGSSLSNVLTTGSVYITATFEFEVAALPTRNGFMGRESAQGMQVAILATLDDNDSVGQYYVPSTGRISNIRMTLFSDIASALGNGAFIYFGKKVYTDSMITSGTNILQFTDGVVMKAHADQDIADIEYNLALTTYSREVLFVKKGEPLQINYQYTDTQVAVLLIEFDFIPDFNAVVDIWYSDLITNVADATAYIWDMEIPFDMYIEKIELQGRANDLTIDGFQYLMGIKRVGELLSNLDLITGSVLSTTFIDNAQASQLPSNILGALAYSSTAVEQPDKLEAEVYDYYPEGAWIALVTLLETSGTEDLSNLLHIRGRSRVKSSKFGVNYLTGDYVLELPQI